MKNNLDEDETRGDVYGLLRYATNIIGDWGLEVFLLD